MVQRIEDMILTAGPSITKREIEYVTDAVINGWNHHHSDYLRKFEQTFADYVGVKYALATSSCTGALHLSLMALGIGEGDEVIVPEITWIATVSAVRYVGATPVFADIRPDSWVMDAQSVLKLITPKTKAIVPVHLYGHPVEMEEISKVALERGISIIEDAAPSIGAKYKGKRTGSLGDIACFSFQGAKALVTGEGGMLVTNDEKIMEKVRFLNDHGRDPQRPLASIAIGYKYKMSNLQGALGLAQIQRADELVAKKREIFGWYQERLSDIEEISLNVERPDCFSIYWMSSIVLSEKVSMSRDAFMQELKARSIDTRPFFWPISSFPMFKGTQVNNPVSYSVPLRGINLPSGHDRTEEEIDYICAHIREVLGKSLAKVKSVHPSGWLSYAEHVHQGIRATKEAGKPVVIPMRREGTKVGQLVSVTVDDVHKPESVTLLSKWRESAQEWFPSRFKVTEAGTKVWLEKALIAQKDRLLFWVEDALQRRVGHVGLFRFDYKKRSCEIDNIVRGNDDFPGGMEVACRALCSWTLENLGVETLYLRVFSDNARAIKLYEKLGFKEIQRVPLTKVEEGTTIRWIETIGAPYDEIDRYFVTMRLRKNEWKAA